MIKSLRIRAVLARGLRPVAGVLDRRLESIAARLEQHTTNLAAAQRSAWQPVEDRLSLDAALISEHLLEMERLARSGPLAKNDAVPHAIASPGDRLTAPDGYRVDTVCAYRRAADGVWTCTVEGGEASSEDTLRIATLTKSD